MKRVALFVLGVLVGGGLVFFTQRYHVVRTKAGLTTVPKISATFSDAYVDVRSFTAADWAGHKGLVAALFRSGRNDVLEEAASDRVKEGLDDLLDRLEGEDRQ